MAFVSVLFVRKSLEGWVMPFSSARHLVGNEPFAVLLPGRSDRRQPPVLAQMISSMGQLSASLVAVRTVSREETRRYGIVDAHGEDTTGRSMKIRSLWRNQRLKRPLDLGDCRSIYPFPAIFDCIASLDPGIGGEIQLTDGISRL